MSRSVLCLSTIVTAALGAAPASTVDEIYRTEESSIRVETVATGLARPWGLAFLPDGRMVVTEKPGRLRIVSPEGAVSAPIAGVPEVDSRGQGGLLDIALDPDFERNCLLYLSYSEPGKGGNSTAVARAALSEDGGLLADRKVIFSQVPKLPSNAHFGSRLVFDGKGHLFCTLGERTATEQAQDLRSISARSSASAPTERCQKLARRSVRGRLSIHGTGAAGTDGEAIRHEERLLKDLGKRIRDVAQGTGRRDLSSDG